MQQPTHLIFSTLLLASVCFSQNTTYDYAIAGGGTAGLTLALLLSQDPNISVVVLEAGQSSIDDPRALVPEQEGALVGTTFDWNFTTIPQSHLYNNATISVPRGKTLGGSSALNFLIWARPSAAELDAYRDVLGLGDEWSWNGLLPAFKGSENFTDPPTELRGTLTVDDSVHGKGGPIRGSMERGVYSLYTDYVLPALEGLGVPKQLDRTAGNTTGAGFVPLSIDATVYQRSWPASAYAEIMRQRPNLVVKTGAHVTNAVLNSGTGSAATATGLTYIDTTSDDQSVVTVNAKSIILSAGAIQTPQILELSGIGDPAILNPLGIETSVDLPPVGTQASDHLTFAGSFSFNVSNFTNGQYAPVFQDYPGPRRFLSPDDYAFASELLTDDANKPAGTSNATWQIVKHLWSVDDPFIEFGWYYGFVNVYVLHPLSQGTVHVNSSNPMTSPVIDTGYNSAEIVLSNGTVIQWDSWLLSKAVQYLATTVATASPLSSVDARFSVDSAVPLEQQVFQSLGSGSHPTGGAVMLPRTASGVVDQNLKVYGTDNLYVADASVLPISPGEHIMGTVYAVAVKAASLITNSG